MRRLFVYRAGFSLVEILVVCVLLIVMGATLSYFFLGGKDSKTGQRKVTPMTKARDTVCQSNLGQIRTAISTLHSGDEDGKYPESLKELKFPKEFEYCPDGKEPYLYDPQTGTVRCVHPGHEKL